MKMQILKHLCLYQDAQARDREAVGQRRDSGSQATSSHDTSEAAISHPADKILEGLVRLVQLRSVIFYA